MGHQMTSRWGRYGVSVDILWETPWDIPLGTPWSITLGTLWGHQRTSRWGHHGISHWDTMGHPFEDTEGHPMLDGIPSHHHEAMGLPNRKPHRTTGHPMEDPTGQSGSQQWTPLGRRDRRTSLRGRCVTRGPSRGGPGGLTGVLEELHVHLDEGEALPEAVGHQDLLLLEDLRHLPRGRRGVTTFGVT